MNIKPCIPAILLLCCLVAGQEEASAQYSITDGPTVDTSRLIGNMECFTTLSGMRVVGTVLQISSDGVLLETQNKRVLLPYSDLRPAIALKYGCSPSALRELQAQKEKIAREAAENLRLQAEKEKMDAKAAEEEQIRKMRQAEKAEQELRLKNEQEAKQAVILENQQRIAAEKAFNAGRPSVSSPSTLLRNAGIFILIVVFAVYWWNARRFQSWLYFRMIGLPNQVATSLSAPDREHLKNRSMNTKQITTAWVGITLLVFLSMFPPWKYTYNYAQSHLEQAGDYCLIFTPPKPGPWLGQILEPLYLWQVSIDLSRLLIPVLAVIVVCSALMLVFKDRNPPPTQ
jgi:hypothetical protein